MTEDIEKIPSIGISYTVELPGKKALVLQSFVGRDDDIAGMNTVLDKLRIAAERQFSFGMLEHLRLELEQQEKIAADHSKRMADLEDRLNMQAQTNGRREVRLSPTERKQKDEANWHAAECQKRIVKVKQDMAEHEKRIGA